MNATNTKTRQWFIADAVERAALAAELSGGGPRTAFYDFLMLAGFYARPATLYRVVGLLNLARCGSREIPGVPVERFEVLMEACGAVEAAADAAAAAWAADWAAAGGF